MLQSMRSPVPKRMEFAPEQLQRVRVPPVERLTADVQLPGNIGPLAALPVPEEQHRAVGLGQLEHLRLQPLQETLALQGLEVLLGGGAAQRLRIRRRRHCRGTFAQLLQLRLFGKGRKRIEHVPMRLVEDSVADAAEPPVEAQLRIPELLGKLTSAYALPRAAEGFLYDVFGAHVRGCPVEVAGDPSAEP
jgi:hypothetical protein